MNVKWIVHNNKRILYADYRELNTDEMIKQLQYEANMMMQNNGKVLYLGNFENTVIEKAFMEKANELGKITEPLNEKSALVGVVGMKAVLLNTYNFFTGGKLKAFATEEAAKEYLTK
jgi:hypothetical protein